MDTERITDTRITPNKQGCEEDFPAALLKY